LCAFTVVPRAPNFCALRRVSTNFERAEVDELTGLDPFEPVTL